MHLRVFFQCISAFTLLYIGMLYSCHNRHKLWKQNTYENMQQPQLTMKKITKAYCGNSSDNMHKNESMRFLYMNRPSRSILNQFANALPIDLQQRAVELYQRMLPAGGGVLISLHICTGADREDGNMIREAYHPHLLCARATQAHFDKQGIFSAVFLHSDSTRVKNESHSLGIKYLTTLDTHAEYDNRDHTLLGVTLVRRCAHTIRRLCSCRGRARTYSRGGRCLRLSKHAGARFSQTTLTDLRFQ